MMLDHYQNTKNLLVSRHQPARLLLSPSHDQQGRLQAPLSCLEWSQQERRLPGADAQLLAIALGRAAQLPVEHGDEGRGGAVTEPPANLLHWQLSLEPGQRLEQLEAGRHWPKFIPNSRTQRLARVRSVVCSCSFGPLGRGARVGRVAVERRQHGASSLSWLMGR